MGTLIPLLVKEIGLVEADVRRMVNQAPLRYKMYTIPKRSGGQRMISQPAKEVKLLQRIVLTEVLYKLPISDAAMAYRQGISIRDNAAAHVANNVVMKFDFRDFFPSIMARDWHLYCRNSRVFDDYEDVEITSNILFQRMRGSTVLRLAIGAPSSPMLSNILMYEFDSKMSDMAIGNRITYTRYADDLTFSARRVGYLNGVEKALRNVIKEIKFPKLTINEEKTVVATTKYRRVVTGLVLSDKKKVSLGRDRKRAIEAAVHHFKCGKLAPSAQVRLSGMLAFVNSVEPEFLAKLIGKYGMDVVSSIRHVRASGRLPSGTR
jgi:hypothetical protein